MHHSTYGSDRYSQSDHIFCWPSGRSTTGGGGGGWYFGCTSLLGNLLRYVLLCVCVWSVLLLCLAIQSVPETPNLLFVYFGLSLQAAKEQAIHFILYHILYYIWELAILPSKRTVYHFSRKKGCSLKIVFLHVDWYAKLQSWKSSRFFSYSSSEISQFLYVLH